LGAAGFASDSAAHWQSQCHTAKSTPFVSAARPVKWGKTRFPANVNIYRDLDSLPNSCCGGAVAIGNFDGVHRGHARIIQRLLAIAGELGGPALVFTFDPHPARLLHPEQAPAPLCWADRKAQLLAALGVDAVLVYPTTLDFLRMEAREFFDRILCRRLRARCVVEGRNFFFGHNREGTVEVLRQFCDEAAVRLEVVDSLEIDGQTVSSSLVRRLVAAGAVDRVRHMLTEPYRIRGRVIHGAGRGDGLGFPTANIEGIDTLLPGEGVYAGGVWLAGQRHPAAVAIGPNPTFHEQTLKIEAFLLDYRGNLYGQTVEVDFLARLRNIMQFASVAELIRQMTDDVEATRRMEEERDWGLGIGD
jgi:riboflavin kinase/FMN adenylyltransferase